MSYKNNSPEFLISEQNKWIIDQLIVLGMTKEHLEVLAPLFNKIDVLDAEAMKISSKTVDQIAKTNSGFKSIIDKYKYNQDLQNQLKEAHSNFEFAIKYFDKFSSVIYLKHLASVTKDYALSPEQLNAYVNYFNDIPVSQEEFIRSIKQVDDEKLNKITIYKQAMTKSIFAFIKTSEDLNTVLKLDSEQLNKYSIIFDFFHTMSTRDEKSKIDTYTMVHDYGLSKIIGTICKYNFDNAQLKKFVFTLANERRILDNESRKFDKAPDDLERLAKIIVAPNLKDKDAYIKARDYYSNLESLDIAINEDQKPIDQHHKSSGLWAWVSNKIFGNTSNDTQIKPTSIVDPDIETKVLVGDIAIGETDE